MAEKEPLEKDDLRQTRGVCLLLVVGVGAIIVLCFILVAVLLVWPSSEVKGLIEGEDSLNSSLEDWHFSWQETEDVTPVPLRLIPRIDWLARPPEQPLEPLQHPVPYVIISQSGTEPCQILPKCILAVFDIQKFQMKSKGSFDIAYNFLVGGDGNIYEGRGWDSGGAHTDGYNNRSIGISFVGTFDTEIPPEEQQLAAKQLIEEGVKIGKISKDYKLLGHRQVSKTDSQGQRLFDDLKDWPHWVLVP